MILIGFDKTKINLVKKLYQCEGKLITAIPEFLKVNVVIKTNCPVNIDELHVA